MHRASAALSAIYFPELPETTTHNKKLGITTGYYKKVLQEGI